MSDSPEIHPELRDYIENHKPSCPKCGYELQGLPSAVCPECGLKVTAAKLARVVKIQRSYYPFIVFGLCFDGVVLGAMNYAYSLPFAIALVVWVVFRERIKKLPSRVQHAIAIALWLPYTLLVLSVILLAVLGLMGLLVSY